MTIATHPFPPAERLEQEYRRSLNMIARLEPILHRETADRRYTCRMLCEENMKCGTIASVLSSDDGDATAKRHMADAARYARRLLTEAGKAIRVTEVQVIHDRRGLVDRRARRAAGIRTRTGD